MIASPFDEGGERAARADPPRGRGPVNACLAGDPEEKYHTRLIKPGTSTCQLATTPGAGSSEVMSPTKYCPLQSVTLRKHPGDKEKRSKSRLRKDRGKAVTALRRWTRMRPA